MSGVTHCAHGVYRVSTRACRVHWQYLSNDGALGDHAVERGHHVGRRGKAVGADGGVERPPQQAPQLQRCVHHSLLLHPLLRQRGCCWRCPPGARVLCFVSVTVVDRAR